MRLSLDNFFHQILIFLEKLVPKDIQTGLIANPLLRSLLQHLLEQIFYSIANLLLLKINRLVLHLMHIFRRDPFERIDPHQKLIKQQTQTIDIQ